MKPYLNLTNTEHLGKLTELSCVLYLWSAAFPWQLGAMGFNCHHNVKGPRYTGA